MIAGLSVLGLARFQFAMTTVFHFFFVPFSIGMALVTAIMETMYVRTKDEMYKKMTKFWGRIFLLSFAVGVVTGIIQEFQFGMNWSNYSRFMGDIFGAPLAIEALLAFFMESTFIGLWMFTWDRFKPADHAALIWFVWLGTTLSAIWILSANSFMQHPTGFAINEATGRVKLVNFMAVIGNPQLWVEFPHVVFGAFVTAAFAVAGMSAWRILKHDHVDFYKKSMRIGLTVGLIASIGVVFVGDLQTRFMMNDQPMKFAATEGIYKDTKSPASWAVVELINTKDHTVKGNIEIPYLLSLLSYHRTTGAVKGMDTVNKELEKKYGADKNYYVPVKTLFWSFRVMAGIGTGLIIGSAAVLWFSRKKKDTIENKRWLLYVTGFALWMPFIANTAGWFITELGRYPWVVYGLYTIADAVSPTTTVGQLLFTNIVYFLIFTLLGGVMIYYSHRVLVNGPDGPLDTNYGVAKDPFAKEAFAK
ncbi:MULTISPECIES: cytochrome ubiquinol oxidase subunit I [unclassified Lacticaseibacillus]|uniref:cytochrome ubiquinol oxidase subunit I n=1 Tax=unclassified Lacticaseibacillus TaxID=2759744 RepID=UPI0019429C97|nr:MULTISPECIES: cytochrome ubiquinol oxidase subunit I [unclassified Lacticaseibacillus]